MYGVADTLNPTLETPNPNPKAFGFLCGSFQKVGVPYVGVLVIRILPFKVLYSVPLFSETPMCCRSQGHSLHKPGTPEDDNYSQAWHPLAP